jgi:hypothetical protein
VSETPFEERTRPAEVASGLLASISLAASAIALVYRPVRLAPFAILIALIAVGMAGRESRLAPFAVAAGTICWLAGMTIAVVTGNPLY